MYESNSKVRITGSLYASKEDACDAKRIFSEFKRNLESAFNKQDNIEDTSIEFDESQAHVVRFVFSAIFNSDDWKQAGEIFRKARREAIEKSKLTVVQNIPLNTESIAYKQGGIEYAEI